MRDRNPYDDDHDGQPGGRGLSAEYIKKYDPDLDEEHANLPEKAQRMAEQFSQEDEAQQMAALRESAASHRVQFWPNVGRFVIPRQNTYAAHAQLIENGLLEFKPAAYPYSLRVMVETAQRPDLFDPAHPEFAAHRNARKNLLAFWNDVKGIYMDDGSFDPGDEKFVPHLTEIAQVLGEGLRSEKHPTKRFFGPHLNTQLLDMEGDGAAHVYDYVLKQQRGPGIFSDVISEIRAWLGMPVAAWGLPPRDYTAFSEPALNASTPQDVLCMNKSQLERYSRDLKQPAAMDAARFEQSRQEAPPVEEHLNHLQRRETVDHGIVILRWFKDIKFSDKSVMELMDTGTPQEKGEMVGLVAKFVQYYQQITARALQRDPGLAHHEKIQQANEAAKVLQHSIELLAKLEKPVSMAQTQQISADITQQPDKWHELKCDTVDRLMQTLKGGLETAVSAFEQQQQDVEQAQEEQAARLEAHNALQAYFGKGRRRKKSLISGLGAKKQQKLDQALRADDYAAGQGIHSRSGGLRAQAERGQEAFRQGMQVQELGLKDMELVRSIGKNLMKPGGAPSQGAGRPEGGLPGGISVADVDLNDKLKPDDQEIAKTIIDQRRRDVNRPKQGV